MLLQRIDIYIYAILVLLFLFYDIYSARRQKSRTSFYYQLIIVSLILIQILETLAWVVDGGPGFGSWVLNQLFNYLLFLMVMAPLSLWLVYLDESIIYDSKIKQRRIAIYAVLNLAIMISVISNPITNFIFTIDAANLYARQSGVAWIMSANVVLFGGYLHSIKKYSRLINVKLYQVILALGLLPLLGGVFQVMFYKQTLTWPMVSLVTLWGYILVQRDEMKRDELTGLYTRHNLEKRINYNLRQKQPFTVMMIDLDHFKQINDSLGHLVGDGVLIKTAALLVNNIKGQDSAYRLGGDEFVLVIESSNLEIALRIEQRIKRKLAKINDLNENPFALSLSFGHAVFDGSSPTSFSALLEKADLNMYHDKKSKNNDYIKKPSQTFE